MKIVIVGAGLAGLHCADLLEKKGFHPIVLEARPVVGGRVRSARDDRGRVIYEQGPWRIPEQHKRVLRLCERLGIHLVPLRTPTVKPPQEPGSVPGLSIWDVHAASSASVASADQHDLATGYADQTRAASGSSPYTATGSSAFFVAPEGFDQTAEALARTVDLRPNVRVHDLVREDGAYTVQTVRRRGERFFHEALRADVVFVCVPPSQCASWTAMRTHARPVLDAVEPGCLNHIYARGAVGSVHRRSPSGLLQQTIGDQYGKGWFQASYSAGRVAEFWFRLFLVGRETASDLLSRLLGFRISTPRVHFWAEAYHHWRPAPAFDLRKAVAKAVQPHPFRLPNLYLCGEAFSSHQAWMEGALETAELATDAFLRRKSVLRRRTAPDELCYDGRLIDVSEFQQVHPGGVGAISAHLLDKDVRSLMEHIGHSKFAYATIFHLQNGWKK